MIIFDFDQTLVDTSPVEHLRKAGKWREVMAQASSLPVYDCVHELLNEIHAVGEPLAIVTKSPDMVPKAFIKQHSWPIKIVIGYHQVRARKPDPEGLLLAMQKAGARPEETYHVGDRPEDTEASRGAGVFALGSAWGLTSTYELKASAPDQIFRSVADLRAYLKARP
jgi:HAD superfamily hydrolase (TIGR01549 family)